MKIWAIADLHLCLAVPSKTMEAFGWTNYIARLKDNWQKTVSQEDLVLVAGDISWAKKLDEAKKDLDWISRLNGTKLMIRGNHDYWWKSAAKLRSVLDPNTHILQNDAFDFHGCTIAGARLWDSPEFQYFERRLSDEDVKIFERELGRLELSLQQLKPSAKHRIAMTHYPPIGPDLKPSRASELLEKYGVTLCAFGHLHNHSASKEKGLLGSLHGIRYPLVAADYLDFCPTLLLEC